MLLDKGLQHQWYLLFPCRPPVLPPLASIEPALPRAWCRASSVTAHLFRLYHSFSFSFLLLIVMLKEHHAPVGILEYWLMEYWENKNPLFHLSSVPVFQCSIVPISSFLPQSSAPSGLLTPSLTLPPQGGGTGWGAQSSSLITHHFSFVVGSPNRIQVFFVS